MIVFPPFDIALSGVSFSNNAYVKQVFIEDAKVGALTSVVYEDIPALINFLNAVMASDNERIEYKEDKQKYDKLMEAKS